MELRNVARQDICHGNSNSVGRGLQNFICWVGIVEWKKIHQPQGCVDSFEAFIKAESGDSVAPVQVW